MTEYRRFTSSIVSTWSSGKRIDVSAELKAAFAGTIKTPSSSILNPSPTTKPQAPTLTPDYGAPHADEPRPEVGSAAGDSGAASGGQGGFLAFSLSSASGAIPEEISDDDGHQPRHEPTRKLTAYRFLTVTNSSLITMLIRLI